MGKDGKHYLMLNTPFFKSHSAYVTIKSVRWLLRRIRNWIYVLMYVTLFWWQCYQLRVIIRKTSVRFKSDLLTDFIIKLHGIYITRSQHNYTIINLIFNQHHLFVWRRQLIKVQFTITRNSDYRQNLERATICYL